MRCRAWTRYSDCDLEPCWIRVPASIGDRVFPYSTRTFLPSLNSRSHSVRGGHPCPFVPGARLIESAPSTVPPNFPDIGLWSCGVLGNSRTAVANKIATAYFLKVTILPLESVAGQRPHPFFLKLNALMNPRRRKSEFVRENRKERFIGCVRCCPRVNRNM